MNKMTSNSKTTTAAVTISETDEVGTPTATYVYSESVIGVGVDGAGKKKGRVDVVVSCV